MFLLSLNFTTPEFNLPKQELPLEETVVLEEIKNPIEQALNDVVKDTTEKVRATWKKYFVGYVGNTGKSTGPHAHIQGYDGIPLTKDILNQYFRFEGNKVLADDVTNTEEDHAVRGSRGIDVAFLTHTNAVIEALEPTSISDWHYDSRTGNYRLVTFEDGKEFLIAHLHNSRAPMHHPKPAYKDTFVEPKSKKKLKIEKEFTEKTVHADLNGTTYETYNPDYFNMEVTEVKPNTIEDSKEKIFGSFSLSF